MSRQARIIAAAVLAMLAFGTILAALVAALPYGSSPPCTTDAGWLFGDCGQIEQEEQHHD